MNQIPSLHAELGLDQAFDALTCELQQSQPSPEMIEKMLPALAGIMSNAASLHPVLAKLAGSPEGYIPKWILGDQAVLWSENGRLVTLKRTYSRDPAPFVTTLHGHGIISPLHGSILAVDTFDAQGDRIRNHRRTRLAMGDALAIQPQTCAFDIHVPEDGFAPAVSLCVFIFDPAVRTYASYCRRTLNFLQEFSASLEDTRIDWALKIIGELGGSALHKKALEAHLGHASHFIRWTALQSLFQLDRQVAESHLERFCHDPHPDVREAARAAVSEFIAA